MVPLMPSPTSAAVRRRKADMSNSDPAPAAQVTVPTGQAAGHVTGQVLSPPASVHERNARLFVAYEQSRLAGDIVAPTYPYAVALRETDADLKKCEEEEIRRIRHLNRLASWAQQDPTGPLPVWMGSRVQEWVLNELKAALGAKVDPTAWQPDYHELKADRDRLAGENEELRGLLSVAKCPNCDGSGTFVQTHYNHQTGEIEPQPTQCQWCDLRKAALAAKGSKI